MMMSISNEGGANVTEIDGRLGPEWLREATRVLAPKSRVVVTRASDGASEALEAGGLTVVVSEAETIVAARG